MNFVKQVSGAAIFSALVIGAFSAQANAAQLPGFADLDQLSAQGAVQKINEHRR
ncbi:MAG: hypothetical protein AAFR04_05310 [Pseudomonadota bacterium]